MSKRAVALALAASVVCLVACSVSGKQADERPVQAGRVPVATAAATPPGGSNVGSAQAAAGSDPWAEPPGDRAAALAALRADIDVMCSAAKITGGKSVMDVAPYIAEHMKTAFKLELFGDIRTATLDEIIERMRKGMARANVQTCDTVDVLIANAPREK